jgi:RimJ/RimL family protein N-acetyltransferase
MLEGKRVVLRPVEERDLEMIAHWRNAPDIRPFFFTPLPVYPGGQRKWYEGLVSDHSRLIFMIETREGKAVGFIGLSSIDARNQECEIGPGIVDPSERSHGYAEEAIELLIRYAFEELNLHRLYAACYPFNRVIELMKLYGFQEEGVLRQAAFTRGKFYDKVILGLLREEWQSDGLGNESDP